MGDIVFLNNRFKNILINSSLQFLSTSVFNRSSTLTRAVLGTTWCIRCCNFGNAHVFYAHMHERRKQNCHLSSVSLSNGSWYIYFVILIRNYFAFTLHQSKRQISARAFAGWLCTNHHPSRQSLTSKLPILEPISDKRRKLTLRVLQLQRYNPYTCILRDIDAQSKHPKGAILATTHWIVQTLNV